jgi:hypothetical protein
MMSFKNLLYIVKFDQLAGITWFSKATTKGTPVGKCQHFDITLNRYSWQIIEIPQLNVLIHMSLPRVYSLTTVPVMLFHTPPVQVQQFVQPGHS